MNKRVLVVDDDKVNREVLAKFLQKNHYDVLEAENGKEAMTILKKQKEIAMVLLDIIMPVMDGFEVIKCIRNDHELKSLPIIVQTVDKEGEIKALNMGANDYILKPYNMEVVLIKLQNAILVRDNAANLNSIRRDALTGLYSRLAFLELVGEMVQEKEEGYYVLSCFDIEKFKVVNDLYGVAKGD